MQHICLFECKIGLFNGSATDASDVCVGWFRKSEQPQVCLHACGWPKILADDAAPLQRSTAKLWWEVRFCMCFITSCALHHLHMQTDGWGRTNEACEQCEKFAVCSILLATVLWGPELVNMDSVHTSGSVSQPRREVGLGTSHPTHEDRGGGGLFCCLSAGTRPVLHFLFSAWERRLATSCVQSHYPQPGRIHRNHPPPILSHITAP